MLTNRPRGFHETSIIETDFSDHHNMILSFCQTHFERLQSKKLEITKSSTRAKFLFELDQEPIKGKMYETQNNMFTTFTDVFRSFIDKHTPLKTKKVRGSQAPSRRKH